MATRAALERGQIAGDEVDELLMGHGRQAGSGPNPARQVVRRAGLPDSVPAQTINKACASGMEAVATAARAILLGETHIAVAGGIESMSRMPYLIDSEDARWGHRMGNFALVDAMYRDGFTCSLSGMIMGETAELLARQYGISREASEEYAVESQRKAGAAIGGRQVPGRDRSRNGDRLEGRASARGRGRASTSGHDDRVSSKTRAGFLERRGAAGVDHCRDIVGDYRWRCGARPHER